MAQKTFFKDGPIAGDFIGGQIAAHSSKTNIGAHAIFLGQVRADENDGKKVAAIEYSAYDEMADTQFANIREDAFSKWSLSCLHIYHSKGAVKAGEISLFVFVSSAHRKESMQAMQHIVEEIKLKVPIWKKEIMEDASENWVE